MLNQYKIGIFIIMSLLSFLMGSCSAQEGVRSISAEAFREEISQSGVQLLDVRTPEEYLEGHIGGAINIDMQRSNFVESVDGQLDKSKPVYLYCRSGARSMMAAKQLAKEGYQVVNLKSGIIGWSNLGYPVVKD